MQDYAIIVTVIAGVLLLISMGLLAELRRAAKIEQAIYRDVDRFKHAADYFHRLSLGLAEKIVRDSQGEAKGGRGDE